MNKKLFTKVVSLSLTAAMILTLAPVSADAAKKKTAKPKKFSAPKTSMIKIGQTKTITATRGKKKSNNDVKYVKFKPSNTKNIGISVKTSDDAVVSVEKVSNAKYKYTGVNTGTAKLTITSRAKTAKGKKLRSKLAITVINPFKVTQTGAYTFTMSTAEKLDKVTKRDIKVVQEGNSVDNAVKDIKLSEDKMTAYVLMEIPFVHEKKYEVTFGKEKDSFVASVGTPTAINIKTQTAVVNKPTKLEFAIVDDKGMDVTGVLDASKITVDVTAKTGYYDAASKKVTLWKVGDTADVKVVYHTWTYDSKTGKENVVEGKGTITCVDKSSVTVVGLDKWTIADRVLSWDTDTMKSTMAQGQNSKIWVRMKKSDGSYVDNKKNAAEFSFEKINTATLYIGTDGSVYATREGMEYAKVTYFDGTVKYQYTLPVTVGAPAKATTLVVNPAFVLVSSDTTAPATPITVKVLDQYGNEIERAASPKANIENISGKDVATIAVAATQPKSLTITKLEVKTRGTVGIGVYKITYEGLSISVTVSSQDVSGAPAGYELRSATTDSIDITVNDEMKDAEMKAIMAGVHLDFFQTKGGVLSKNDNADVFNTYLQNVTMNGEKIWARTGKCDANHSVTIDATGIDFKPVLQDTNNYIVNCAPGVYRFAATLNKAGKLYTVSTAVEVKGSVAKPVETETYSYALIPDDAMKPATVTALAQLPIIKNLLNTDTLSAPEKYIKVLKNRMLTTEDIDLNANPNDYYIDTAALPALKFKEAKNEKTLWVVTEKLDARVKVDANTALSISNVEYTSDTTVDVTFNKVLTGADLTNALDKAKWTVTAEQGLPLAAAAGATISKVADSGDHLKFTVTFDSLNLDGKVSKLTLGCTAPAASKTVTIDKRAAATLAISSGANVDATGGATSAQLVFDKAVSELKEIALKLDGADGTVAYKATINAADSKKVDLTFDGTDSKTADAGAAYDTFSVKVAETATTKEGVLKIQIAKDSSTVGKFIFTVAP